MLGIYNFLDKTVIRGNFAHSTLKCTAGKLGFYLECLKLYKSQATQFDSFASVLDAQIMAGMQYREQSNSWQSEEILPFPSKN